MPMANATLKSTHIQKPFRCPEEFDTRLNRAKGALMLQSGNRITDNQFLLEVLDLGLEVLLKRIDQGKYADKK